MSVVKIQKKGKKKEKNRRTLFLIRLNEKKYLIPMQKHLVVR